MAETQGDRLDGIFHYLANKGLVKTKQEFCEKLGINPMKYSLYVNGVRTLSLNKKLNDNLRGIGVSPTWFLTGEGEKLITNETADDKKDEIIKIPILDVKVSAGYGATGKDYPEIVGYLPLSKEILKHYKKEDVVCLEIRGDSMEPDFKNGDYVLSASGVIASDGFYIINIAGDIFFKRLQFIKLEGKILIKSINPAYETIEIREIDDKPFSIIGKVFRHISIRDL